MVRLFVVPHVKDHFIYLDHNAHNVIILVQHVLAMDLMNVQLVEYYLEQLII